MNNDRRKLIDEAMVQLSAAREILEIVRDEEQEALENLPENLQESEQGQRLSETADALDTAVSDLEEIENSLEECKA